MSQSPFTISEIGEPGSLVAVADFSCPKCAKHSRFFAQDQAEDGSFTCPHCGLWVQIRGTRLSDYQEQLEAVNASLGDFASNVTRQVKSAARRLKDSTEPDPDQPSS